MISLRLSFCGAALALLSASPAVATTTVASVDYPANGFVVGGGNFSLGTGTYRINLTFSQPVSDVDAWIEKVTTTNDYCNPGEVICGGDDVSIFPEFEMVTPQLYQVVVTVSGLSTINGQPWSDYVRETSVDSCCGFGVDFTSGNAGRYTVSYTAVPEPATWAMMLFGFGAIGFAARRRAFRAGAKLATS
jgi:hypothetical protein